MAKRWRSMDETERAEYRTRLDAVTDGMVALFADETHGPEMWGRFGSYAMSLGDVLDYRNAVRAFAQHIRVGNATPTDLRTWSEWVAVGRTPKRRHDIVVLRSVPSHLWDVADTDVTDRKAWRKAPAKPRRADGARTLAAVAELIMSAHAVDVTASLPDVPAQDNPVEVDASPRQRETARMRAEGRVGSFDAMARAEFADYAGALFEPAEAATRGHMLNRKGTAKDVNPKDFFPGNPTVIRAYASEELMSWFDSRGGIPTLKRYVSDMLGTTSANRSA